jgi:hypothetical protein
MVSHLIVLRREYKGVIVPAKKERLYSRKVPRAQKSLFKGIIYCEREHSVKLVQGLFESPFFDTLQNRFGV